jgi:hypothetical protein
MGAETAAAIALFAANNAAYISAASMAISAASTVASYQGQQQQARAQARANEAAQESAIRARNSQIQQLQTRALQERDAASERMFETRIQALEGDGAVRAQAAAKGIEGNTVDALAREYWAKQGRAETAVTKTANNTLQQLRAEQEGAEALLQSRFNSMPQVREPSLWGLGLGIGQSIAGGARDLAQAEARNPSARR